MTKEQIETLDKLQSAHNQGRGIQVIKDIIALLNHGNIEAANNVAIHDNDKIRNYPDVQIHLRSMLVEYNKELESFEKAFKWLTETDHGEE